MSGIPARAPRGLRWTETPTARAITTVLAIIALAGAIFLGARTQAYISCVGDQQRADAVRTGAISAATDLEREADRRLLAGPVQGGPSVADLRHAAVAARERTDRVRAANPPQPPASC